MSSMLDQAIIDAHALKEAAMRNAEQEILEKYSQDIREAVDALLEQEEELEIEDEVEVEDDAEPELEVPLAAADGEPLCPCPEEEEVIELDLDQILKRADDEEVEEEEMTDREEFVAEMADEAELRGLDTAIADNAEEIQGEEEEEEEDEQLDEEIDLDESDLKDLVEELKFEYEPKPGGWASGTPVQELEQEQFVQDFKAELEESEKEKKELQESFENLTEENQKFRRIILQLKDKLDEVSVSNARLLYTNRVLENPSLNERQKAKLVETISKAQTIEKAKMIYEALQSAVDGTSAKVEKPESLNEVVSKQSTMLFSSRRDENKQSNHVLDRMQRLAGIKHS